MNLNEIGKVAYENAVRKGFYETPRTIGEALSLIHSEVSEALEDLREGKMQTTYRGDGKPEGFPSELADIIIRVCDLATDRGIDLDKEVRDKMKFNATRPYKHGGKSL
jgi:NTP pyrophosphatase (non-canonical NTP hydrolase)